jgi:protein farnesyltransferase/geranylgeranyltransferase type-1 subunit alpha
MITSNGLSEQFEKEFEFSRQMIEDNQKNYQVWHHRKMLGSWAAGYKEDIDEISLTCEESKKKLARMEIDLTEKMLTRDPKNYHAWQHRQWVLSTFK